MRLILVLVLAALVSVFGVASIIRLGKSATDNKITNQITGTEYFLNGSDYKGNYVFGGAMQLAVNELNNSILHDKLQLNLPAGDTGTNRMLAIFNREEFSTRDLDNASYYVKSGYGQGTVTKINRESRAKFPSKSFADLDVLLAPKDIIAYAYFLKQIEYATEFEKDSVLFLGKTVNGFVARNKEQKQNVQIVEYKNDDNFIIKLKLKDNSDEIYLAKGFNMNNPKEALKVINKSTKVESIDDSDVFQSPEIHLELNRNYDGFINKRLLNKGFEDYYISVMTEKIKFDMDNKGARVENEAVIVVPLGYAGPGIQLKIKRLILDKPYWVMMKRADSANPYFILGVKNSDILGNKQ